MTNPNDLAFPSDGQGVIPRCFGLTKREYFAAMVLPSICIWDAIMNHCERSDAGKKENLIPVAVEMADALIKELSK